MSVANDVREETLVQLAQARAEDESVLSLYLDLDPSRFATADARASQIDSLLDEAEREVEEGERPHEERQRLRASLQRARELLGGEQGWAQGARALALFLCEPLELELLLRLPHPVRTAGVISDAPFIAPLVESGPAGRVCVALVDERLARILRGSGESLREAVSFGDEVHGRHSQGGWSQARYQRSAHEDSERHLQHVARVLGDLLRIAPYDRLLIGCAEPLWPRLVEKLDAGAREALVPERLSLEVQNAGVDEVAAAVTPLLAEEHRAREDEALARLREHHGRDGDGRAAVGLADVLRALVERRVEALIYEAELQPPGVICPRCGWMDADGERCPADGEPLQRRQNIMQDAIQAAVGQSAELFPLRERPELGPLGEGVAATLRF